MLLFLCYSLLIEKVEISMMKKHVISEAVIQAAFKLLEKRIAEPPPIKERSYTRREAFIRLRAKAKEALSAGHTLEAVLDDLKGIGLGMTLSTARQYMKPGRRASKTRSGSQSERPTKHIKKMNPVTTPAKQTINKGTFAVAEDETEI
jgi:hypothetical protein